MKELVIQLYLFWGVWKDIKTRSVPLWYFMVGMILSVIFLKKAETYQFENLILSFIPGGLFLLFSMIWPEKIGHGDGLLLVIAGSWFPEDIWEIYYLSLILISIFSLLILFFKKYSIKIKIPYYPFFWIAFLICRGDYYV